MTNKARTMKWGWGKERSVREAENRKKDPLKSFRQVSSDLPGGDQAKHLKKAEREGRTGTESTQMLQQASAHYAGWRIEG
jgi:hypothetical protein